MRIRPLALFLLASFTANALSQAPPQPGPEHKKLAAYAGTWDAVIEMADAATGQMQKSKGVSVVKVGPGGLWVLDHFTADFGGMPFEGQGQTGYDPAKGKNVGTWIDAWSTVPMVLEGGYDASGKVLTLSGMAPGMDGKPVMHKLVTTDKDANTRVFEMFLPGEGGKDMKIMTITYTRRADGKGADKK
ncbi:MAG: DUF1579 domain-containing protein [Planctomycetota bacterium]